MALKDLLQWHFTPLSMSMRAEVTLEARYASFASSFLIYYTVAA
jgi:hypothetical protein